MPKNKRSKVQRLLKQRYDLEGSWEGVSRALGGLNRGLLCAVYHGTRPPTPQLCKALGLSTRPAHRADPMDPGYRQEVNKFIAWARQRMKEQHA